MTLDGEASPRPSWQSAPLGTDTEVTGHPIVELALSSDTDEGDIFAYLEDVSPDGISLLVTEGQLRANYFRLKRGGSAPGARPALPWHGFALADYAPRPFAGGRPLRLKLDLMPTAWLFRKGHRIRLSLAAADWPSFALHPGLSPANDPAGVRAPVWTIHRGPGLSAVTLPVVPERK
jgi:putative CocE/NonD family hydrolase